MSPSVGSRLGHYDVTALIGEGGMGQVYQATDTKARASTSRMSSSDTWRPSNQRMTHWQPINLKNGCEVAGAG